MAKTVELDWGMIRGLAAKTAGVIDDDHREYRNSVKNDKVLKVYPVPNGGIYAGLEILNRLERMIRCELVEDPRKCDVFVDDIIDSGATRQAHRSMYGGQRFYALVDKPLGAYPDTWVSFPWERMNVQSGPEENIVRLLQFMGENPERPGLLETPSRVAKSYGTLFGGYDQKVEDVIKTFDDISSDEMIIVKDVEFYSTCEHHMIPFFGKAHIAYIPDKKVVGVSKLARILEIYSRRLQVQERLTTQVTEALMQHLEPKGAACVIEAKHLCMVARGVQKQHSNMITSSLLGVFREPAVRTEFLQLIKG